MYQAHDTGLSVRRKNAHGLLARTSVSTQHPLQGTVYIYGRFLCSIGIYFPFGYGRGHGTEAFEF